MLLQRSSELILLFLANNSLHISEFKHFEVRNRLNSFILIESGENTSSKRTSITKNGTLRSSIKEDIGFIEIDIGIVRQVVVFLSRRQELFLEIQIHSEQVFESELDVFIIDLIIINCGSLVDPRFSWNLFFHFEEECHNLQISLSLILSR